MIMQQPDSFSQDTDTEFKNNLEKFILIGNRKKYSCDTGRFLHKNKVFSTQL